MKIARVFPRRTNATPDDTLAFTDAPGLFPPGVDEVHVSVAFTWAAAAAVDWATGKMVQLDLISIAQKAMGYK